MIAREPPKAERLPIDAITREVVSHALVSAAEDMSTALGRRDQRGEFVDLLYSSDIEHSKRSRAGRGALGVGDASEGVQDVIRRQVLAVVPGDAHLKWVFAQDYWCYNPYLPQVAQATHPNAPFNETHWCDPNYVKLYDEGIGTVDQAKRTEICHEMQAIDHEQGGYIIPYFPPVIDGYALNVQGLVTSKTGISLNSYRFLNLWLS